MKKQICIIWSVALTFAFLLSRSEGQVGGPGLQGAYTIVSISDGGKAQPVPKGARVVITKDKLTMLESGKIFAEYSFKIDATKNPAWIDLSVGTSKSLGIYELKGDQLRICINNPGGIRSTKFESKDKSENDVLMVFLRAPK